MAEYDKQITPPALPPDRPIVGITLGDFNGIGPEVILKTLQDARIMRFCIPVLYASQKLLRRLRKSQSGEEVNFQYIQSAKQANPRKPNLVTCWDDDWEVTPGMPTEASGKAALLSLQAATQDALAGMLDAIVTAPISKQNMPIAFGAIGHTQYLAQAAGHAQVLMVMAAQELRVAVVTDHIPISEVSTQLNAVKLTQAFDTLTKCLKRDFGCIRPKVAILGLNPHAGDGGLIGTEEKAWMSNWVKDHDTKGAQVLGPFSADAFFGRHLYRRFDAVLAMYHDQGLIPFKTLAGAEGVNYTAGLPFVRTSPAHGTGFDIAGQDIADPDSFRAALFMACEAVARRR